MASRHEHRERAPAAPVGYAAAVVVPVGLTLVVTWLRLPAFVFEHLVVLLVLAIAVPWGFGPAVVASIVSVVADNMLLREPFGRPTVSGVRDVLDLVLFAAVAIVVSSLVTRARSARFAAEQAAERERQAREDRDRLIAAVSHDLATPLAVLSGTVQFARQRGTLQSDLPRLLTRLETASARAMSLVRTLVEARDVDAHELEIHMETVDFGALVAPIVQMMDRLSERHPVVYAPPDTPVRIRADAARLQRVVENLVNNAIKYSPDGGAVEVSVSHEGAEAVLRVRDYGIGISPEARPHIFDRSYRAPEASSRTTGLGLGLSIAAHVVERHDGRIDVDPAPGGGSVFAVRLPLAAEVPPQPAAEEDCQSLSR